ncbi:MAG: glycine oxidase ThiO [Nocardioidaceae bacterium]
MTRRERVVVLGGGIVGLSCADALVTAGHDVTVVDPSPGLGATYAAAGMLAPAGEAWFGEEALLRLGIASAARWPAFAADLERRSGHDVDLRTTGTLLVGTDRDDVAEVRRSAGLLAAEGVEVEQLTGREVRRHEPTLGPRVAGGALLPHDHQVNPRRVATALLHLLGDRLLRQRGTATATGVLLDDGRHLDADVVVLATGAAPARHVRPVRGEVVRARCADPPRRVVRARVHGEPVYLVPRRDGEVVIGATEEEHPAGQGPQPTVGGTARLLEAARSLMPGLDTAELLEVVARDRPGSPDNGPLLGPVQSGGPARHVRASGHYRGGVLLAPVTAATVRAHVDGTAVPTEALAFGPHRFDPQEDPCS